MQQMNRNILALDAAFGQASACLLRVDGQCYHATGDEALPHSQGILPLLETLLDQAGMHWTDLQMLAVGTGPGSFTGLRIAAATVAGINTVLKLPLLPLSSLAVTALQTDVEDIWILEDARSGDAYVGHYVAGRAVQPDSCLSWDKAGKLPVSGYASQSGLASDMTLQGSRIELIHSREQGLERLVALMLQDRASVETGSRYPVPVYIRPSQAERNASIS